MADGPADLTPAEIESEYQRALYETRRRLGSLDTELGRRLETSLRDWAVRLERTVGDLPEQRAAWQLRSAELTREAADDLATRIVRATDESRTLAYDDTLGIWRRTLERITGDSQEAERLLGTLRVPSLSLLGQFSNLNAAGTWKTLVLEDAAQAAAEANEIILQGLTSGIGPEELARRLRQYVQGSETFAGLFHDVKTPDGTYANINLNNIPRALWGAGRKMDYNARRIAFTELQNARTEAEIQYFRADPLVGAVRYLLAPDRGTQDMPDECDVLAQTNWYGLGPGIYPVDKVPPNPHPFCRCERMPVARGWDERLAPKELGDFDGGAWRSLSRVLGKGMRRESWLGTVGDALRAVAFGRAAA